MNSKLFLVALIPCGSVCDKDEGKIQSRSSQKYSDNWDSIFSPKEPEFKVLRPATLN